MVIVVSILNLLLLYEVVMAWKVVLVIVPCKIASL